VVPIEDLLREEFQRTDALEPPERDAMLARVAIARRRRAVAAPPSRSPDPVWPWPPWR